MLSSNDARAIEALGDRLLRNRGALLEKVRQCVVGDAEVSTARTLAPEGFLDHLPQLLDALQQRLHYLARPEATLVSRADPEPERVPAEKHGLRRWQQGYSLPEATREWRHLSVCVIEEIGAQSGESPQLSSQAVIRVMREVAELIADGMRASAERHGEMQRAEAARRAADLKAALAQVRAFERERVTRWRQVVHDLRGSVGAVVNASVLLNRQGAPEKVRALSQEALHRGLATVGEMLTDLASLARLEAGQEQRRLGSFDVAELLRQLRTTLHSLAANRGLVLEVDGPDVLEVEGDALKVQRIVQNLVLNAIKYTERGGVWMTWRSDTAAPLPRWILTVQDTGPGFDPNRRPAIGAALEIDAVENEASPLPGEPGDAVAPPAGIGEGIGLSIVKQLCELLDATIELHSEPGRGTTFQVTFPARYTAVV